MRPRGRLAFFSAAALAAVLAVVLPAGIASAASRTAAGNRVWAISSAAQAHVRADRGVPAGQRLGDPAACPFCPSGACVAPEAVTLRFTQTTASATFKNGSFAGRTIGDIAGALRSGAVKPSELPIGTITRDGNPLILNTRSSLALLRGGINPADWTINDMTGDPFYEELLTQRLAKNGLTNEGTGVLRITGAGRWASWLG